MKYFKLSHFILFKLIIFIYFEDEVDALLSTRKSTDNEASLKIKTQFLVGLDGVSKLIINLNFNFIYFLVNRWNQIEMIEY